MLQQCSIVKHIVGAHDALGVWSEMRNVERPLDSVLDHDDIATFPVGVQAIVGGGMPPIDGANHFVGVKDGGHVRVQLRTNLAQTYARDARGGRRVVDGKRHGMLGESRGKSRVVRTRHPFARIGLAQNRLRSTREHVNHACIDKPMVECGC